MNIDRKKIYIAIIIVCFLATGAVLYYNFSGPSAPPPAPEVVNHPANTGSTSSNSQNTGVSISRTGDIIYATPTVFPNDTKFDWSLLQSDKYKALTPDQGLSLDPAEVGRNDPFLPF